MRITQRQDGGSLGGGNSTILYVISPTKAVSISANSGNANDKVTVAKARPFPPPPIGDHQDGLGEPRP